MSHLERHYVVHLKNKKYECHICHKKFGYSGDLNMHIDTVHDATKHKCKYCKSEFSRKANLARHVKTLLGGPTGTSISQFFIYF